MASRPENNHWRKLEDLFHSALELEPGQRAQFLDQSCGHDADLRREVEVLLDSSDRTWGFFQKPLQAAAEQVVPTVETSGQRIGPYQLIRLLGEGGMGKVYLAARADDLYQQQVAIKLVQSGTSRTRDLLLRFSAERQILANLVHPNIGRLLDAGVAPDGSPYLVMEYIEGVAIDQYVASGGLSVDKRLSLFREVCSAAEYAHRNLVVHRDIKPANILVTAEGTPKLLDFGIAKLLLSPDAAPVDLTRATERLMTPEYASPEQARGQAITTATDVYALGGLLYALLTGRPPFKIVCRDPLEVARIICERPPTRPSAADHDQAALPHGEEVKLKGDLDNIVLKALRKEPEKRYATVVEFSEDVRRYLGGYPLQAGSNAWSYRAGKFVRRHKIAVAAALLMTLAIVGFSVGMGVFAQRARIERNRAEQERHKAEQEASFLSGLFQAATPEVERGKTITARDVLDLSAQRIDRELAEPTVRAAMLDSIGDSYVALGLYDQGQPLLAEAYAVRKQQFGDDSAEVSNSAMRLANVVRGQGKFPQEETLLREALRIRQKRLGENSPAAGEVLSVLGECLYLQSRTQEAEPILRKALAIGPENTKLSAGSKNFLALVVETTGQYAEAAELLRSSAGTVARVEGADSLDYLTIMHNLAGALSDLGNLSGAESTERKVLEARQRISGPQHPDTTYSLNNLGWILLEKGDWASAEPFLKQGMEINRKQLGEKHPRVAGSINNWARVLQAKGDYNGAEKYYRQALAILAENKQAESWPAARIESNLGVLQLDRGDYAGAERYARQALELRKKLGGDENPDVATSLSDIGVARAFQRDAAGAEPLLRQVLAMRKKIFSPRHLRIVAAEVRLGEVLTAEGKPAEAEPILRDAVESAHHSPFALTGWQVAEAESALGVCLAKSGQTAEARTLILKSNEALKTHPEAALRKQAIARAARAFAANQN